MKSYIKSFLIAGTIVSMTSCTDLDTPMVGNYETFPDNEIAKFGAFDACYHYTRNEAWFGRNFWEGAFLGGDEAVGICLNGVYDDKGRYRDPSVHNFRPDLEGCGEMDDMMKGISYTNRMIMTHRDKTLPEDADDPTLAPLRAIRAYYHFWMMELYGDVPILEKEATEGEPILRRPRAEVAAWIEKELLAAIPDLNEANDISTYGRPNKWMA